VSGRRLLKRSRATLLGAALLLCLGAAAGARADAAPPAPAASDGAAAREQQFLYLLRTYPERPPNVTLGQVAQLIDQGPFLEQDRATFWIGSARLALGDRAAARHWFSRLAREHPGSVWVQRSYLGLAEAAAMERNFNESLGWYARAEKADNATVRELARIARPQILTLQRRQWVGWGCAAVLALAVLALAAATLRAARQSEPSIDSESEKPGRSRAGLLRRALALPAEARILLPLLAILALSSLRQDPAPRGAALELCLFGGGLVWLSGAYLRARPRAMSWPGRAAYALAALLLLGCASYLAVWRHDLVGMVMETWRAGPD